ncbi:MAG: EVE domain-containing protein, partial [Terracidiphilus sp.]
MPGGGKPARIASLAAPQARFPNPGSLAYHGERMAYFLFKTEPDVYSFDDFLRDKETVWDNVTNP